MTLSVWKCQFLYKKKVGRTLLLNHTLKESKKVVWNFHSIFNFVSYYNEQARMTIMEGFLKGSTLRATKKLDSVSNVRKLAIRFIFCGILSEIFACSKVPIRISLTKQKTSLIIQKFMITTDFYWLILFTVIK